MIRILTCPAPKVTILQMKATNPSPSDSDGSGDDDNDEPQHGTPSAEQGKGKRKQKAEIWWYSSARKQFEPGNTAGQGDFDLGERLETHAKHFLKYLKPEMSIHLQSRRTFTVYRTRVET